MASHFVWVNRNKESIALDLKAPEGRAILDELIASADVMVQNLAPGVADGDRARRGQLVGRHPRLVAVDLSGYGAGGPYEPRRAYDLVVQAESGSIATTGWADRAAKPGIAIADLSAGPVHLRQHPGGVVRAGTHRPRPGHRGQPDGLDRRADGLQPLLHPVQRPAARAERHQPPDPGPLRVVRDRRRPHGRPGRPERPRVGQAGHEGPGASSSSSTTRTSRRGPPATEHRAEVTRICAGVIGSTRCRGGPRPARRGRHRLRPGQLPRRGAQPSAAGGP